MQNGSVRRVGRRARRYATVQTQDEESFIPTQVHRSHRDQLHLHGPSCASHGPQPRNARDTSQRRHFVLHVATETKTVGEWPKTTENETINTSYRVDEAKTSSLSSSVLETRGFLRSNFDLKGSNVFAKNPSFFHVKVAPKSPRF